MDEIAPQAPNMIFPLASLHDPMRNIVLACMKPKQLLNLSIASEKAAEHIRDAHISPFNLGVEIEWRMATVFMEFSREDDKCLSVGWRMSFEDDDSDHRSQYFPLESFPDLLNNCNSYTSECRITRQFVGQAVYLALEHCSKIFGAPEQKQLTLDGREVPLLTAALSHPSLRTVNKLFMSGTWFPADFDNLFMNREVRDSISIERDLPRNGILKKISSRKIEIQLSNNNVFAHSRLSRLKILDAEAIHIDGGGDSNAVFRYMIQKWKSFEAYDKLEILIVDRDFGDLEDIAEEFEATPWDPKERDGCYVEWRNEDFLNFFIDMRRGFDFRRADGKLASIGIYKGNFCFVVWKPDKLFTNKETVDELEKYHSKLGLEHKRLNTRHDDDQMKLLEVQKVHKKLSEQMDILQGNLSRSSQYMRHKEVDLGDSGRILQILKE